MQFIKRNKENHNKGLLIVFFIYPFASFILALNNLKSKYSFRIILLFFVLFGYTFIAENKTADSYSYIQEFHENKNITTSQYLSSLQDILSYETSMKDVYTISTYYLVSRITENYHVLMALWAIVFSFFFLKAFRFFVDRPEFIKSYVASLLVFLFIFSNNIFNINGVRFYTAAWMSVYAIFEIVVNKKLRFLSLIALIPLIHISYFSIWAVMLIYLFSIKYDKFWVMMFIISFFVANISVELIQKYSNLIPTTGQYMANSYAGDDYLREKTEIYADIPLYAKFLISLPRFFINLLVIIFIMNLRIVKSHTLGHKVFLFLLVWMTFVNFTWSVPSVGVRFIALSIPFISYICLIYYRNIPQLRNVIYLVPLIYAYPVFQWIRVMVTVTDPYLLFSLFPHLVIKNLY